MDDLVEELYKHPEELGAWLDDIKATEIKFEKLGNIIVFKCCWVRVKRQLIQPTIEFIINHELIDQEKLIWIALDVRDSYTASYTIFKDGRSQIN